MNIHCYRYILMLILSVMFFHTSAQASLLIAPLRVVFDDRERGKTVTIINTSQATTTYRIELINLHQLSNGEYKEFSTKSPLNIKTFFADQMIRFSPRQVTLKPNQRQQVRLSVRRPSDLAKGEYRSHLKFTQLPTPEMLEKNPKNAGIKLYMLTGFSIPVQVRQGPIIVNSKIIDAKINKTKQGNWQIETTISRTGDYSTFGKLTAYWRASANQEYEELNFLNNLTLYRETDKRKINIVLKKDQIKPGQYKITYTPNPGFKQKLFDEYEFSY